MSLRIHGIIISIDTYRIFERSHGGAIGVRKDIKLTNRFYASTNATRGRVFLFVSVNDVHVRVTSDPWLRFGGELGKRSNNLLDRAFRRRSDWATEREDSLMAEKPTKGKKTHVTWRRLILLVPYYFARPYCTFLLKQAFGSYVSRSVIAKRLTYGTFIMIRRIGISSF